MRSGILLFFLVLVLGVFPLKLHADSLIFVTSDTYDYLYPLLLLIALVSIAALIFIVYFLKQEKKTLIDTNYFFLPEGAEGIVFTISETDPKYYQIKVRGEIWKATSNENIHLGDKVQVISVDTLQLLLTVKKVSTH